MHTNTLKSSDVWLWKKQCTLVINIKARTQKVYAFLKICF